MPNNLNQDQNLSFENFHFFKVILLYFYLNHFTCDPTYFRLALDEYI